MVKPIRKEEIEHSIFYSKTSDLENLYTYSINYYPPINKIHNRKNYSKSYHTTSSEFERFSYNWVNDSIISIYFYKTESEAPQDSLLLFTNSDGNTGGMTE